MALQAGEQRASTGVIDSDGRWVVVVTSDGTVSAGSTDVTDRTARLLGHVTVDNLPPGAATDLTVGNRFAGGKTPVATSISSSGNNTIHTPAAGKKITLFWVGLSSSQNNAAEVLVTVKLGAKVCYEWYLGNPGAFSHWEPIPADNPDDALVVNLSTGGNPVLVNATYTEA